VLRTQIVLEVSRYTLATTGSPMVADIELVPDAEDPSIKRLQLVILESLVIRRDITADAQGVLDPVTGGRWASDSTGSSSGTYGNSVQRSGLFGGFEKGRERFGGFWFKRSDLFTLTTVAPRVSRAICL